MKRDERKTVLRCAVYTRVSTEVGLEQDFNSLDNQREASEAYIKSQPMRAGSSSANDMTTAASPAGRWSGRRFRSCWTMFAPARST
jgi:hypothetical protein